MKLSDDEWSNKERDANYFTESRNRPKEKKIQNSTFMLYYTHILKLFYNAFPHSNLIESTKRILAQL